MKAAILILSLAINLALAMVVLQRASGPVRLALPTPSASNVTPVVEIKATNVVSSGIATTQTWSFVEAPDYRTYIERLRGIHCPEETIRDIIIADVSKLYARQWHDSRTNVASHTRDFWETTPGSSARLSAAARQAEQRQRSDLVQQKRDLIRELLNADLDEEMRLRSLDYEPSVTLDTKLAFLSEAQRNQVKLLRTRYQEGMQALESEINGGEPWTADQRARYQSLQQDWNAGLDRVLSPQEKEQYLLKASPNAELLQNGLGFFESTPEEYGKLLPLFQTMMDGIHEYEMAGSNDENDTKKNAFVIGVVDTAKQLIGTNRFAAMERVGSGDYHQFRGLANRYDVAPKAADQALDLRKSAESQVKMVNADQSLTAEQRQAALSGIKSETERALTGIYGPAAIQWYKQTDGAWLRKMAP